MDRGAWRATFPPDPAQNTAPDWPGRGRGRRAAGLHSPDSSRVSTDPSLQFRFPGSPYRPKVALTESSPPRLCPRAAEGSLPFRLSSSGQGPAGTGPPPFLEACGGHRRNPGPLQFWGGGGYSAPLPGRPSPLPPRPSLRCRRNAPSGPTGRRAGGEAPSAAGSTSFHPRLHTACWKPREAGGRGRLHPAPRGAASASALQGASGARPPGPRPAETQARQPPRENEGRVGSRSEAVHSPQ